MILKGESWWTWRDSNFRPSLMPRKLLILQKGRSAEKAKTAGAWHISGTQSSDGRACAPCFGCLQSLI